MSHVGRNHQIESHCTQKPKSFLSSPLYLREKAEQWEAMSGLIMSAANQRQQCQICEGKNSRQIGWNDTVVTSTNDFFAIVLCIVEEWSRVPHSLLPPFKYLQSFFWLDCYKISFI